jgi:demethylmenaquinone methyltransferase/2-methoxy-6-polyprenyl-1,4-benzoquinol methylase
VERRAPSQFADPKAKEAYVQDMFDSIAPRYDLLNRLMAANLDQRWRRLAAREARGRGQGPYLDVGAGTGDLTLALHKAAPDARVLGLDLARGMIALAPRKKGYDRTRMGMVHASGLALPAADATFEGITNAFVLRNLADQPAFFREAHRALQPGGRLVSLEINRPPGKVFGPLYRLYFLRLMPRLMRGLSGNPQAYAYLADSVARVDPPEVIAKRMADAGFARVEARPMLRGAVVLFVAERGR